MNPLQGVLNFFMGDSPWKKSLEESGFPDVSEAGLAPPFEYLQVCLGEVGHNHELPSLVKGLGGWFVEPGPGGNPIQNPDVLPTGKNMHAMDLQSIPARAAAGAALVVVDRLLGRMGRQ